jgi:putative two-component system response regulator
VKSSPSSPAPETDPLGAAIAVTILALASLAETRDSDTGKHVLRVQHYVRALALRLRNHPRFESEFTDLFISQLFMCVPLYDMGTIGIPDRILLKPGRLSAPEYEIMKTHTTLAYEALVQAEQTLGLRVDQLQILKDIAHSHQEKWDGSGYPQHLSGDAIPASARLVALADVYDALISDRVYKAGVSHEAAVGIIFQGHASHFDPDMVDAFIEIQDEFQAIAQRFADTDLDMQKKMEYMANAIAETTEL